MSFRCSFENNSPKMWQNMSANSGFFCQLQFVLHAWFLFKVIGVVQIKKRSKTKRKFLEQGKNHFYNPYVTKQKGK